MKHTEKYAFLNSDKYLDLEAIKKQQKKPKEYKLWYEGNINSILRYYKTSQDILGGDTYSFTPSFMRLAPAGLTTNIGGAIQVNNFTVYHSALAALISRAMSNLLFSTEPTFNLEHSNETIKIEYQERLDKIIVENDLSSLLQKAAEYESYSGAVAFKPIIDPDFSEFPLIQIYPKEEFIVNRKYDKVVSIVFLDTINHKDEQYILFSEYGRGFIKYKLVNGDGKEFPLSTTTETKDLNDLFFYRKNGEFFDKPLFIYKENKPGERSDYENSLDDFNAIDETYSNMMNYIRKTAPKRVVSESTLKKTETGDSIIPSVYDSDLIIRWDNTADSAKEVNEIQATQNLDSSIQGYLNTMNEIQNNIARTVGLSIKTIKGSDLSGANASADALSIRENIDLRTRDNKLISWKSSLNYLTYLFLVLDSVQIKNNVIYVDDYEDFEIITEFYNPSTPTFEQEISEVRDLIDAGLIDHLGGLERLWVDSGRKSKEEVLEMYARLRGEVKIEEKIIAEEINQTEANLEAPDDEINDEEEDVND